MSESQRIADQLDKAFRGGAWHGPALWELVATLPAEVAAARALAGVHTIFEIVRHATVWNLIPLRRLRGEKIESVEPADDWPAVPHASAPAWRDALEELEDAHHRLHETVLALDDSRLSEPISGSSDDVYNLLHGVIQHDVYHAGQIALLIKAVKGGS
jgi:uncharacterized damage-inducible protein DinB